MLTAAFFQNTYARYACAAIALASLLTAGFFLYRAEVSKYAWNTFRVAPEYAVTQNPDDAGLLMDVADYYFNMENEGAYDLTKAESYYVQALQSDPDVSRAWYQLGRISFIKGQFATSLYRLNKQEELHGDAVPEVHYVRGLVYGFEDKYEEAEAQFRYLLQNYDAENPWTHNDLAWTHYMQGEFAQSRDVAKRGLTYTPDSPWLLTMYGLSLLHTGQRDAARLVLTRANAEAEKLTTEDWARAYPGNDPAIRAESLAFMKQKTRENLTLVNGD